MIWLVSFNSISVFQKAWVPGTRRSGSESGWPGGSRTPRPIVGLYQPQGPFLYVKVVQCNEGKADEVLKTRSAGAANVRWNSFYVNTV